jgi:uncharacterized membrane protein YcaP (DUF421 family)
MEIILRTTAIYGFLYLVTKGLGKRELSQMSPFELILLVTMGDLIQQGATQDDRSITGALLAVSTISFWIVLFSWITFRSKRARSALEGIPVVIIRDGEPVDEMLKIERVTLDEVAGEARSQGIASLRQVDIGILESDGQFSFILKGGPSPQQQQGSHQLDAS